MPLTLADYKAVKHGAGIPERYKPFLVDVPEGKKGPWRVERVDVKLDLDNMRMMRDGRGCWPGIYTRLVHKDRGTIMSDTNAECDDMMQMYRMAQGRVLMHGLGLGVALKAVLSKPNVTAVDVVELESDVIALVGKHYQKDPRVTIYHGDVFHKKWKRDISWHLVWHDVWDDICADNLPQMRKLRERYRERCEVQLCWCERECRRMASVNSDHMLHDLIYGEFGG